MHKTKSDNLEIKRTITVIGVTLLLMCLLYAIKVIGRVDVEEYVSINLPELNKPDDIFVVPQTNINYTVNNDNSISNFKDNFNINDGNNKNNVNNENGENNEDNNRNAINKEFFIADKSQVWDINTTLRIFENPIYQFKEKIAPGSTNSYAFNLVNNKEIAVICDVTFLESNSHNINMKYRLVQNGNYICGDDATWVTYSDLKAVNVIIEPNKNIQYTLEWKWFSTANDTIIGQSDNVKYSLIINTHTEEMQL